MYERLKARKRDDESFADLVDRLLDEATPEWQEGFGTLSTGEGAELERIATDSREGLSDGLGERQREAVEELSRCDEDADEAA